MNPPRASHGNHHQEGDAVSVTLSETGSAREQTQSPTTLAEAHEVLRRQQPATEADPQRWVEFHRHCAAVYSEVSKVDLRHRYEALSCAGMEIRKARDIEHRLNPEDDEA
jgi:hypothetical protein